MKNDKQDKYRKLALDKRFIFLAMILITLGVTLSTALKHTTGALGTIFIAVGGLFFIIGMKYKKDDR